MNTTYNFECKYHNIKEIIIKKTINMFLFTYFKNINRILRGLDTHKYTDKVKIMAS